MTPKLKPSLPIGDPLSRDVFLAFYDRSLPLYRRAFSYSDEKKLQAVFYVEFLEEVLRICSAEQRPLEILDCGCGAGDLTTELLQAISTTHKGISFILVGVDPSTAAHELYYTELNGLDSVVQVDFVPTTMEEYIASEKHRRGSFDVVLCDHSLYCLERPELINELITSSLKDRGVFLASLASESSPVSLYRKQLSNVRTLHAEEYLRHGSTRVARYSSFA